MHWEAQLLGDPTDLRILSESFVGPDLTVAKSGDEYVLRAKAFESMESAGCVRCDAQELVTSLSGASRLQFGATNPISVGAVYLVHDDGTRDTTVFPGPVVVQIRALPVTVVTTGAGGVSDAHRPADQVRHWLAVATADPNVAKALRLRDGENLTWVDLYRILEVIDPDGGDRIAELGWATKNVLTLFRRTANSVTAAGDDARHGHQRTEPPTNPMTLSRARGLIDRILKSWLQSKRREHGD